MTELHQPSSARRWALIATLMMTAGTLWFSLHSSRIQLTAPGHAQLPELYAEEPGWYLFNRYGQLEKHVQARRLEQWPGQEAAYLIEPRIQLRDQQQGQWHTQARQGWFYPDHRPIVLEKQVVLTRQAGGSGLVMKSAQLRIADSGDRVETDKPVVLQTGSWHFTSDGLRADLGAQRLELLERVRGTHE
jgi:LPS export ABC transporter protein LptC